MQSNAKIGKYEVVAELGRGNFGVVYRAYDHALGKEKAIKILKPAPGKSINQVLDEARVLARCDHKHVVRINEANVFLVDGVHRVILDLEYLDGGSLEGLLRRQWVPLPDAVRLVRGALRGLEHAHANGFVHRDFKPGNILIDNQSAKLSDFGLATLLGPDTYASGSNAYKTHLAPEFFTKGVTTLLTDVFAAGITLFRSVNNISDWREAIEDLQNAESAVHTGRLIDKIGFGAHVPDKLCRIIKKACHPNPARRYQTALSFGQQLDSLRFGISWRKVSELEWSGCDRNHEYSASVDVKRGNFDFRRNGRRVTKQCHKSKELVEVFRAMHAEVRRTSLV